MSNHGRLRSGLMWLLVASMSLVASTSFAGRSRLHPPFSDQAGALRLAQVIAIASRGEIITAGVHYQYLLDAGIPDSLLRDGSLATGRVNCCGGDHDFDMALWFYVPPDVHLEYGDIVEVKMGRQPRKSDKGMVNVARRVRERSVAENHACRWDPPNERLWGRILYCDWMESEGWTKTRGANKTWLKREDGSEGSRESGDSAGH